MKPNYEGFLGKIMKKAQNVKAAIANKAQKGISIGGGQRIAWRPNNAPAWQRPGATVTKVRK